MNVPFILTFDVDALVGVLLEVEPLLGVLAEQVADLLVVDLEVGGVDEVLHVLVRVDRLEDVLERPEKYGPNLELVIVW